MPEFYLINHEDYTFSTWTHFEEIIATRTLISLLIASGESSSAVHVCTIKNSDEAWIFPCVNPKQQKQLSASKRREGGQIKGKRARIKIEDQGKGFSIH